MDAALYKRRHGLFCIERFQHMWWYIMQKHIHPSVSEIYYSMGITAAQGGVPQEKGTTCYLRNFMIY